jgi:hypothetical protein
MKLKQSPRVNRGAGGNGDSIIAKIASKAGRPLKKRQQRYTKLGALGDTSGELGSDNDDMI